MMTDDDKLKANMAAANMLELRSVLEGDCNTCTYFISLDCQVFFDLFTKKADCMAVVKALGEKYHTDIISTANAKGVHSGWRYYNWKTDVEGAGFTEFEEAVASAMMEIE